MVQAYKPGQLVPESGIYSISHEPQHTDMSREIIVLSTDAFRAVEAVKQSVSCSCMRPSMLARSIICRRTPWERPTGSVRRMAIATAGAIAAGLANEGLALL